MEVSTLVFKPFNVLLEKSEFLCLSVHGFSPFLNAENLSFPEGENLDNTAPVFQGNERHCSPLKFGMCWIEVFSSVSIIV